MPTLKNRSRTGMVKVYRPSGTKYAEAKGDGRTVLVQSIDLEVQRLAAVVAQAFEKFVQEHGYWPAGDETVVEVVGITGGWDAQVLEVKDMGQDGYRDEEN